MKKNVKASAPLDCPRALNIYVFALVSGIVMVAPLNAPLESAVVVEEAVESVKLIFSFGAKPLPFKVTVLNGVFAELVTAMDGLNGTTKNELLAESPLV